MADRITDEVNDILCQEAGAPSLSKQAVLDLIDQGASQGGPQAGLATSTLPSPSPSPSPSPPATLPLPHLQTPPPPWQCCTFAMPANHFLHS